MVSMADRQYVLAHVTSTRPHQKAKSLAQLCLGRVEGDFGTSLAISFQLQSLSAFKYPVPTIGQWGYNSSYRKA